MVGSKTCTHKLKLRHVITTDMVVVIFPLEDDVTIIIGIWNFKNEGKLYRVMYVSLSRGHDKAGRTDTLYDDLYREAPPKGVPFSGFRNIKGLEFPKLYYMKQ